MALEGKTRPMLRHDYILHYGVKGMRWDKKKRKEDRDLEYPRWGMQEGGLGNSKFEKIPLAPPRYFEYDDTRIGFGRDATLRRAKKLKLHTKLSSKLDKKTEADGRFFFDKMLYKLGF